MEKITSKQLLALLKISKDTLKHWRYGYYISADKYRVYYREDMIGVPCQLVSAKSFDYYEYDLDEVIDWVNSWKVASQKKISIIKKLLIVRGGGTVPEPKRKKKK